MHQAGAGSVAAAGLAKENEDIFIPGSPGPISLPQTSPGLQLLQRIRDEAHRFALGYHHKLRKKQAFTSALDAVPGIGPRRKRNLIRKFGSVSEIRQASLDDLASTGGISRSLARKIKEHL